MSNRVKELDEAMSAREGLYGYFADIAVLSTSLRETWQHSADFHRDVSRDTDTECRLASEAANMILHKLSRIAVGGPTYRDNWVDIAGYAMRVAIELDRLDKEREGGV